MEKPLCSETERANARRVLCLVLPELALTLARRGRVKERGEFPASDSSKPRRPLGVVLYAGETPSTSAGEPGPLEPTRVLSAVDESARRFGITCGQTLVEARCLCSHLEVRALPEKLLRETLTHLGESLWDRASVVAIEPPDSILLEIGSVANVLGGEARIAEDVLERVRCLGYVATLAIAEGPRLAQLLGRTTAKHHPRGLIVSASATRRAIQPLLLSSLSFTPEQLGWLGRLGLMTLGELARFPKDELIDRLGAEAARLVRLAHGQDDEPLVPLVLPRSLEEHLEWDEPLDGFDPMRFLVRRLTTSLESRLMARGEAAERLRITFFHDRAIARHRRVPFETHLDVSLASALWYAEDWERVITLRCEKTELRAPTVALSLTLSALVPKLEKQLEFSWEGQGAWDSSAESRLPLLLAELAGEIGDSQVGLLSLSDSHRPENKSLFGPYRLETRGRPSGKRGRRPGLSKTGAPPSGKSPSLEGHFAVLTRLLLHPIPIRPPLRIGATVFVGTEAYVIQDLRFEQRLERVEWWDHSPVSRDYVRLWLKGAEGGLEALAYVDRPRGKCFVQAIAD
jgi:protein ImuB